MKLAQWTNYIFKNITSHPNDHYYAETDGGVWLCFTGDGLYQFDVSSNGDDDDRDSFANEVCNAFNRITTLFDAIKHGDVKHQAWLKQAIIDHFEGRQVKRERKRK